MQPQFEKFKANVTFNCTTDNTNILADKTHIKTVLFNLIDNAIKYCKEHPVINIELSGLNHQFKIAIQDNGIGIDEKYQSSIFEKFYRVPKNNVAGYGLGLSYVTHIMNLHNGAITVQSNINQGSTFTIILNQSI